MERQVTGMSCKLLEGFHPTALSQPKHGESQRPDRCTSLASWLAAFRHTGNDESRIGYWGTEYEKNHSLPLPPFTTPTNAGPYPRLALNCPLTRASASLKVAFLH